MTEIDVDIVEDQETLRLWTAVGDLVGHLPGRWVLIGGLMVQLHAIEHGIVTARATVDIDLLGEARPPGALGSIDAALRTHGFELVGPDLDGYAHRYERDGLVVDVLAPDGIKPPASLGKGIKAVGVPGGSQALSRSELVTLIVDGRRFELRRPTLLGAVLIKTRSLMVHSDPEAQREDLLRLLALIEDPRAMSADLRKTERRWLRQADERLDTTGVSPLDDATTRRAVLAYRLLAGAE
jgi:hypothetical protein